VPPRRCPLKKFNSCRNTLFYGCTRSRCQIEQDFCEVETTLSYSKGQILSIFSEILEKAMKGGNHSATSASRARELTDYEALRDSGTKP
jgi:hypothetical protein